MKRPLVIAAAAVGAVATVGFALPNLPPNALTDTINERLFHEKDRSFTTALSARADERGTHDPAAGLPSWIPSDAKHVRVKTRDGGPARLIRFTLTRTPLETPSCPGPTPPAAPPTLDAKWWPGDLTAEARTDCRDAVRYHVVVRGKRVYAWTDGEPSPGAGMRAVAVSQR
ncbi:hypothetical protein ACN20G_17470 [Streptomyces sp. BI20]|uniref:hypothetical protein n=1 Tax=Streptomyces sp. BI20 TaxID=3403460 RepID=UPI003C76F7FA